MNTLTLYAHSSMHNTLEHAALRHGIPFALELKHLDDLWDIDFIQQLFVDVKKQQQHVFVLNPKFSYLDFVAFYDFVRYCLNTQSNVFFSPRINPVLHTQEPVYLALCALASLPNFVVEFLYRTESISVDFRNELHKNIRGNSISRVDIPKYCTNLDSTWLSYDNAALSAIFLEKYLDIFYPSPTTVHVALSNRCNLKCVMCPYHAKEYRDMQTASFFKHPNYMDTATFRNIAKYCGKYNTFLQFGQLDEPLIHPQFLEFLDIAKEENVQKITITTNGTMLNQHNADAIAQSNVVGITFSLDAIDRESYKKIRGHDYDQTLANIEYLLSALAAKGKKIQLGVCFILQGENAHAKSQDFLHYWIQKVDKVKFHQLTTYYVDEQGILLPKHEHSFRKHTERYACSIPWTVMFVLPDCKVSFCCHGMSSYATSAVYANAVAGGGGNYWRHVSA